MRVITVFLVLWAVMTAVGLLGKGMPLYEGVLAYSASPDPPPSPPDRPNPPPPPPPDTVV